jgi:predicted nuclease with TOPRIM domain
VAELQVIDGVQSEMDAFVESEPTFTNYREIADETQAETQRLARANLEREGTLEQLRADLDVAKVAYSEVESAMTSLDSRKRALMGLYNTDSLRRQLEDSARAADEESEDIARGFEAAGADVGSIARLYLQSRKQYHLLRAKSEVLQLRGAETS